MISPRAAFPLALVAAAVLTAAAPVHPLPMPDAAAAAADTYATSGLPLLRWWDALSIYTNVGGGDILGGFMGGSGAFFASLFFYAGSLPWFISSLLFLLGANVSLLELLGQWVDETMASVLTVFAAPDAQGVSPLGWLMIAAVISTLAAGLLRARRFGTSELLKRLGSFIVVTSILFFSIAQLTTVTPSRGTGGYSPPIGTPGWVVNVVQDSVSFITDAPATTVQLAAGLTYDPDSGDASLLSCDSFIDQMQIEADTAGTVTGAISSMWETAAVTSYSAVQFSDTSPLGQQVVCRMLDRQASADTGSSFRVDSALLVAAGVVKATVSPANTVTTGVANNTGSNLFRYSLSTSNSQWSAAMLGWALCDRTADGWVFDSRYLGFGDNDGQERMDERCSEVMEAFVEDGEIVNSQGESVDLGVFEVNSTDIGARVDQVQDDQARSELIAFLVAMTGKNPNVATAFMYAAVAPWGAFPLIIIGAILTVLSITIIAFLVACYTALIVAMFSSKPFSAVLWPPVARLIGAAVLTGGAALIMGIVALFASAISGALTLASGGSGTAVAVIGSGLAPGLAILALHLLLRKLRVPSPLSVSGARAWAKGSPFIAGAAGAAVGAGVGSMLGGAAKGVAKDAAARGGRKLASAALDKVGLGGLGVMLGGSPGKGRMDGGQRERATDARDEMRKRTLAAEREREGKVAEDGVHTFGSREEELAAIRNGERAEQKASRAGAREERARAKAERRAAIETRAATLRARRSEELGVKGTSTVSMVRSRMAARREIDREERAAVTEALRSARTSTEQPGRDVGRTMNDPALRRAMWDGSDPTNTGWRSTAPAQRAKYMAQNPATYAGAVLTATGVGATVGLPLLAAAHHKASGQMKQDRFNADTARIDTARAMSAERAARAEPERADQPQPDSKPKNTSEG